jgi:hypothetical protein
MVFFSCVEELFMYMLFALIVWIDINKKVQASISHIPAIKRSRLICKDFWTCVFRPGSNSARLFSRRKVIIQISIVNHSGWAWPIRFQFWKGSSRNYPDVCLSWQRMQKMHFKRVPLSSNCRLREKVPRFVVGSAREKPLLSLDHWGFFKTFPKWLLGGPRDPKQMRGRGTYGIFRSWAAMG